MGALADIFSNSRTNYNTFMGGRSQREFLLRLVNNTTSATETIIINPEGITKTGLKLQRHEFYHGFLSSITLGLRFSLDTGCGGTFLKSAFDTYGTRANVYCYLYKYNPATNDFDIYYTGKVDYSQESYSFEPNERIVSANLLQTGLQQKLLSRDKQDLNLNSTTSIDGTTVTGISQTDVEFTEIDIYLSGESVGGGMFKAEYYSTSKNESIYFAASQLNDYTQGRINLNDPTEGAIYINDTAEAKDILVTSDDIDYTVTSYCNSMDWINIIVRLAIYNSSDVLQTSQTLYTFLNTGEGSKSDSGSMSINWGYNSVPAGGYVKFWAFIQNTYMSRCELTPFDFMGVSNRLKVTERSNSIGNTVVKCYHAINSLQHLFRLATSSNTALYYNPVNLQTLDTDYITSGFLLRGFTDKGCVTNIRNVFKTLDSLSPVCLIWDETNQRFEITYLEYAYQFSLGYNFGKVKSAKITPKGYFNKILGGCASKGEYEKQQGAFEFNLECEHTTSFSFSESLDLRLPLRIDSIGMELLRRNRMYSFGVNDDKDDSSVFYVSAPGQITAVNVNQPLGFEGIEQYYNGKYISRINLIRCSHTFSGIFYKDSGESIRFANNAKDINISYYDETLLTRVNMNDAIPQSRLLDAYVHPEYYELEVDLSDTDLSTILNNLYKYMQWVDDDDNNYYFYIDNIEMSEFENTAKVSGFKANMDR